MTFSDHSPINLECYTSHLKDEDTKTYCDTSFLKTILSVDWFNQEISKTLQTINYSESLEDCFHQFASKYNRVLNQFAPFRNEVRRKENRIVHGSLIL